MIEAIDANLDLVVVITEGIPVADSVAFVTHAVEKGVRLIGPNCPGIISPGRSNVGITPADITGPGGIRAGFQVGNPHLPDDVRTLRHWLHNLYWYRRGPRGGHHPHRCSRRLSKRIQTPK